MTLRTFTAVRAAQAETWSPAGALLEARGRRLVVNPETRDIATTVLSDLPPASPSTGPVSPGVRALIRQFLKFYFFDEGALSKNVNYSQLVLPAPEASIPFAPRSVSYLITKRCNMRCVHCYNDSGDAEAGELPTEERLGLAHYLGRWGVRLVTITGGEPLLHRDTVPIIRILAGHGVHVKVSTNGWRLTPEFLEQVEAGIVFQVNVSLDGAVAETHDAFRKSRGSFTRVLAALAALRQANVRILNLNVSVHHRNLSELERICELAEDFGANSVSLKPVLMTGRAEAEPDVLLTASDVEDFRRRRDGLARRFGRLFKISGTLVGAILPEEEEDAVDCFAAETAMFVASNGDLLPCENLQPFLDVPNLRDMTPLEAWLRHPSFAGYRDFTADLRGRDPGGCSGCPAVGLQRCSSSPSRTELLQIR